ncbi:hypothetical protein OOK31_15130 [Streptomyces sp. NBC_00249]|uniref:hypothetical protein n=1 Tax=Streptomyces sp. NBC_00249 TaxID=2975690 RepID=UPI002259E8AB|nr:hypothetical protein [Streptomyces sp. NBC_00249]MCX5195218.1 hypothetical protein [Streptomyces sp. NBC_00249]
MAREGYTRVRAHWRRRPAPRRSVKRLSGWTVAALIAGVWLWTQVFGVAEEAGPPPPAPPQATAPVPAGR